VKIEEIKKEIIDHVQKNIIASFSFIFLLFGGLIFFIYYLDIKYIPNLDLISSVQLLAVASLTGIILILSAIATLIFPGLFWQKYIYENEIIANVWSDKKSRILVIFIIPMFFVYFSLFLLYIAHESEFKIIKYQGIVIYLCIIILNLLLILLYRRGLQNLKFKKLARKKLIIKHKVQRVTRKEFLGNYIICMGVAYYGSFISIIPTTALTFVFLGNYREDFNSFAIGCLFLTLCVFISNSIILGKPKDVNSIYWFFTVGLISFLCITALTNTVSTFPKAIMKTYKLGNIETSSIVIDKQGCNTINKTLKLHKLQDPEKDDGFLHFPIKNESCIIPNVHILSKLGTEAYIEFEFDETSIKIEDKEYKTMRFVIPSSSIITYNLIW